jgi:hypothetical protein
MFTDFIYACSVSSSQRKQCQDLYVYGLLCHPLTHCQPLHDAPSRKDVRCLSNSSLQPLLPSPCTFPSHFRFLLHSLSTMSPSRPPPSPPPPPPPPRASHGRGGGCPQRPCVATAVSTTSCPRRTQSRHQLVPHRKSLVTAKRASRSVTAGS